MKRVVTSSLLVQGEGRGCIAGAVCSVEGALGSSLAPTVPAARFHIREQRNMPELSRSLSSTKRPNTAAGEDGGS